MDENQSYDIIKSDQTLLDVIEVMAQNQEMGVTELANEVGKSKSVVYRHLNTLHRNGYVMKSDGKYRLSLWFLNIGTIARRDHGLYDQARKEVDKLAQQIEKRVWCLTEENGRGVFVHGNPGPRDRFLAGRIGRLVYLHQHAAGKAVLAYLPEHRVEEIIEQHSLPAATENTISSREKLFDTLETIRSRGYATNRGEDHVRFRAIGMPILAGSNDVIGAVSVGKTVSGTSEDSSTFDDEVVRRLEETTNEISLSLDHD